MKKVEELITKYAWPIFIVTIVVTLFFLFQLKNMRFEDDFTKYVPASDPNVSFYNSLESKFSSFQKKSMIIALEFDDLFTPQSMKTLEQMVNAVSKISAVRSVSALTNMPKIIPTEEGFNVKDVVEILPQTDEEAQKLKSDLQKDELIWGKMVTEDGKATIIAISFHSNVDEYKAIDEVEKVTGPLKGNAQKIVYFGLPIITKQMATDSRKTMMLVTPISALVLLLVLYWGFRTFQGVLLPIFISIFSSIWILGLAVVLKRPLTMISSALPLMMIALVSAYGIHFMNRYYDFRQQHNGTEVIKQTLSWVLVPIFLSAATTVGGFFSLLTATFQPVSDFGFYSGMGIIFGFVLATFSLAAFLTIFRPQKTPKHFDFEEVQSARSSINKLLNFIYHSVVYKKRTVIIVMIIIIAILAIGIPRIKVETTVKANMGASNPITLLLEYFKNRFGGSDYNYVYLKTENVKNPFILREMVRIAKFGEQLYAFKDSSSIANFVMSLNEAVEGPGYKGIPDRTDKIGNLWLYAKGNSYVEGRISKDENESIVECRAEETTTQNLNKEIKTLENFLSSRPHKVKVLPISSPEAQQYLAGSIVDDMEIFLHQPLDNRGAVKTQVLSLIQKPTNEFVLKDTLLTSEIVKGASLQIGDLGLQREEVLKALNRWNSDAPQEKLENILMNDLALDESTAQYLADELMKSQEEVGRRGKMAALRTEMEKVTGKSLGDEFQFIFYQVLDSQVYMPADDGNITVSYALTGSPIIQNNI
ncbi:MAG: MMPL family transporter, partial [Atribacterota bacterium]